MRQWKLLMSLSRYDQQHQYAEDFFTARRQGITKSLPNSTVFEWICGILVVHAAALQLPLSAKHTKRTRPLPA